ncbi:AfsR/SARP family transcriptional regulator [Paractinoplanes maris]|uniref:AfsR/SARP family transcriptional regulator n=1 Tax=Paractinoplanes maris TaxID=1734446 RepID=UPI002020B986|nr:BTAD domain-containing putative transcriptional regulator [Actinoplanes maris]
MSDDDRALRFALLGPLRVWRGEQELDLGPAHSRLVLALLLARSGRLVEIGELVQLLWGADVPPTAVNMVHRHIGMLRRVLEPGLAARSGGRWLSRDVGGYRLALDGSRFDLADFRQHVAAARERAGRDGPAALDELLAGLSLWRGRCGAGLSAAVDAHPDFVAIDREQLSAVRAAAAIALGHGAASRVLPVLTAAAARHPLDEALQAQLLLALAADGNQSAAVSRYGEVRAYLADELGVDPGAELQAAYLAILQPGADEPGAASERVTPAPVPPAQLPSDLRVFVGREDLIDEGLALLSADGSSVPILVLDGMPGVGKTALAIHLAHRLAPRFTDGQLYADLRGFDADGRTFDPADVLQLFLVALGVHQEAIPASLDGRAALYRSVTAGRRLLIVLDNARDADQVRPLLPGTAPNAVLVTSRGRLGGLATMNGAHLRRLEVLTEAESVACITGRIGAGRAEAESEALKEIIDRCGRLPLALAVVAARAAGDADQSLRDIATELRSGGDRLTAFSDDGLDRDVRAVFTWSYRSLSPGAARLLELLTVHPGADITVEVAASLGGIPQARARSELAELVRTGLLCRYLPRRYRQHDLVRVFAAELAAAHLPPADRRDAWHRLVDHFVHTTDAAVRLGRVGFAGIDVAPPVSGAVVLTFDDLTAARGWFAEEHVTVRAVIDEAAARTDVGTCWKLAMLAKEMFQLAFLWPEWALTSSVAVEATTRAGDLTGMAQSHRSLAGARHFLGDTTATTHHLEVAAGLFEQTGDRIGRAEVLMNLGWVAMTEGDHDNGIEMLHESLGIFVQADRPHEELNVRALLADHHLAAGDDHRSREMAVSALRIARRRDDAHKISLLLGTVSRLEARRGHTVSALRMRQYIVDEELADNRLHEVAMSLIQVGAILYGAGEVDDACRVWRRAGGMADAGVLRLSVISWLPPEMRAICSEAVEEATTSEPAAVGG